MKSWLVATLACVTGVCAAPAWSAEFDPTSLDWNGLNALQAVAGLVDLHIEPRTSLDWSQVDEHDVLLVIAPQVAPSGQGLESLRHFVDSGGRLIVADDTGPGAAWLEPFGLHLEAQPGRSLQHYESVDGLPLVTVGPDAASERAAVRWQSHGARMTLREFLAHELHRPLVLNHPGRLRLDAHGDAPEPVAWGRYDEPGMAWLAETDHGAGRVLALADPSLWLNAMLERFHDNKQFAANVLRYYCVADRPCRVTLLSAATSVHGVFNPHHPVHRTGLRAGLDQLAAWLKRLATLLAGSLVAPALALGVLLLTALAVLWQVRVSPPVVPPQAPALRQRSALAETVRVWLDNGGADFRKPARHLATHLAQRLAAWEAAPLAAELKPQSLDRIRDVLATVTSDAAESAPPLGRTRFGQLAADVEWADSLLKHTDGGWQDPQNRAS